MTEATPTGLDPHVTRRQLTVVAETDHLRNMQHRGRVAQFGREFVITSDEPDSLGGDNEYPTPLEYFAASIGFCLLTQVERYARMLGAHISAVRCNVVVMLETEGSVMAGTIASRCTEVTTEVDVESPEPPELVAAIVRNADQGCYIRATLRDPVQVSTTTRLNNEALDLEAYPSRPPRRGKSQGA